MSDPLAVLVVLLVWVGIGLALALVMGRRGHSAFGWLVLGALMGPFALVLAIDSARHEEHVAEIVAPGVPAGGLVDVIVGVDGSPCSNAAVEATVALFGERIGRLALAHVATYDAVGTGAVRDRARDPREVLAAAARLTGSIEAEQLLLSGQPAAALAAAATDGRFGILVVGARGAGLTEALLGSVATRLTSATTLPVLVVPACATTTAGTAGFGVNDERIPSVIDSKSP